MCGISVIISKNLNNSAINLLIQSLNILQNRGYDSFGSCSIINNKFVIKKTACNTESIKFSNFVDKIQDIKTNITMGHTRWATHGGITEANAHPHISNSGKFSIVHNGIINNYSDLKIFLKTHGFKFYSDTDTEVIVNLIDYYYSNHCSIEEAITKSMNDLEGTYGLAIICLNTPDTVYLTRKGSPLLVGENESYVIATSETSGFINEIKHYYPLNNDIIKISASGISTHKLKLLDNSCEHISLTPHPFKHWTVKEIYDQHASLLSAINNGARISDNIIKFGGIEYLLPYVKKVKNLIFLGCGTSLHACHIGMTYFKKYKCIDNIYCYDAAEFTKYDIPQNGYTVVVFCSQSGETMDLIRVFDIITPIDNCITVGIVNVPDSSLARLTDCGIYINSGKENAVASTKSFTNTLLVLYLFSLWYYQIYDNNIPLDSIKAIHNIINNVHIINNGINDIIPNKCLDILNNNNIFILGKGNMEYIAKEMALKMKEICYIHAEGYSGSALKHGPFALLTKGFPVILLIDSENKSKMLNVYKEIESREAEIVVISNIQNIDVKNLILLPECNKLQEILFMVVLQHIAYRIAILRGINPDQPRNLAKVVTVE